MTMDCGWLTCNTCRLRRCGNPRSAIPKYDFPLRLYHFTGESLGTVDGRPTTPWNEDSLTNTNKQHGFNSSIHNITPSYTLRGVSINCFAGSRETWVSRKRKAATYRRNLQPIHSDFRAGTDALKASADYKCAICDYEKQTILNHETRKVPKTTHPREITVAHAHLPTWWLLVDQQKCGSPQK